MSTFTEEEKQIFINFFINEKARNKKQNFKTLIEKISLLSPQEEIDFYNQKWGNSNNDNLLTFLFSQPNFFATNTKIKHLIPMDLDWSYQNNLQKNLLHLFFQNTRYITSTSWMDKIFKHIPKDRINWDNYDCDNKHYSYYKLNNLLDTINKNHLNNFNYNLMLSLEFTSLQNYSKEISKLTIHDFQYLLEKTHQNITKINNSSTYGNPYLLDQLSSSINNVKIMLEYNLLNLQINNKTDVKKMIHKI